MSSQGFSFPPPPPPPPASFSSQSDSQSWNSARGRGGRGLGRGRGPNDRIPRGSFGASRGGYHDNGPWRGPSGSRGNNGSFSSSPNRGQKRRHDQAFNHQGRNASASTAPPPVPSFGFQMPVAQQASPPKHEQGPSKSARKNLLGLTPSFDEKDGDEDEEAKFAAQASSGPGLQFAYQGQMASLNSPEELAAWIAERRKRFYKREKAEEAAAKAKAEAEERTKRKAEYFAERQRQRDERDARRGRGGRSDRGRGRNSDGASQAEKLQQELAKARRRIAELESQSIGAAAKSDEDKVDDDADDTDALLASSSDKDNAGSVDGGPVDDETSSSGSSSDSDSEADSADDDAPEEATSKRQAPERVPPPPRERKEPKVCRDFARSGRCPRGRRCYFKHEPPENLRQNHGSMPGTVNGKSLHQKLTEQQQEISDELVLQHILYLGNHGYLADPEAASEQRDSSK